MFLTSLKIFFNVNQSSKCDQTNTKFKNTE